DGLESTPTRIATGKRTQAPSSPRAPCATPPGERASMSATIMSETAPGSRAKHQGLIPWENGTYRRLTPSAPLLPLFFAARIAAWDQFGMEIAGRIRLNPR